VRSILSPEGDLIRELGHKRVGDLRVEDLQLWWDTFITHRVVDGQGKPRSHQTGVHYLNALARVLRHQTRRGVTLHHGNPVEQLRQNLAEDRRGKGSRAERDSHIRPLTADAMDRLVAAATAWPQMWPEALILALLDTGMRLGEVMALRWGKLDYIDRTILVDENLPTTGDGRPEPPKSGRSRTVQLSARLASVLGRLYDERFHPGPEKRIFHGVDASNFRSREWRRICEKAEIGHRSLKDLRDTYASQLLTAGVQLSFVSRQLGHADIATTARHYARWAESDGVYREPMRLRPGEVPADLLARLGEEERTKGSPALSLA
jgi:integrase